MRFDTWSVNRVSGEVARDGKAAGRLPQQPLRILIALHDAGGEIVTRDQLVKLLWPTGVVDYDNGLNVAMRKLRVALDDTGERPRYIDTIPKVGYRFIGTPALAVVDAAQRAADTMPRRRWNGIALAIGAFALVLIAVMSWAMRMKPARSGHVPSERAQELYLAGLSLRSRRDIDPINASREKFEAAVKEDPDFAQAWAALGATYSAEVLLLGVPPGDGLARARAAAQRSIALDPDLVEGHATLGEIYVDHDKDFAAAWREYSRALQIDRRDARLWHNIAMWHGEQGHFEDAFAAIRRAREIEPMKLLYAGNYALLLYEARRYDEAIAFLEPLVEANPEFARARGILAMSLMMVGDLEHARAQLGAQSHVPLSQGDLGVLYAKLGREGDAREELDRLATLAGRGYGTAYEQALIWTALGDLDRGCELLTRGVTDHSAMVNWMRVEPRLDALRGRQCFKDAETRLYATSKGASGD